MKIERVAYDEPDLSMWVVCLNEPALVIPQKDGKVELRRGMWRVILTKEEASKVGV